MMKVENIKQLKDKEHKLKKINLYQREILKRDASGLMLAVSGILAFLALTVVGSIFLKKSTS